MLVPRRVRAKVSMADVTVSLADLIRSSIVICESALPARARGDLARCRSIEFELYK
jgi:hypothetical protein